VRKTSLVAIIGVHESFRPALEQFVESHGMAVAHFKSAGEFIVSGRMNETACLVMDANLSGMGGLQLQSQLASSGKHIPMIFTTASEDLKHRQEALSLGALDLTRPRDWEKALRRELLKALKPAGGENS
jgi:FixJ family two-component response regulator